MRQNTFIAWCGIIDKPLTKSTVPVDKTKENDYPALLQLTP